MRSPRFFGALPYFGAVALVATATFARMAMDPMLKGRQPFAAFIIALLLATDAIQMELKKADGDLHLEIRDFGGRFDVESTHTQGFGLRGMRESVRLLGGECLIRSEHDAGLCVFVRLSIPMASGDDE